MSIFDWVIAVIFVISILISVLRGFIKVSLTIIGWAVSIWLAMSFHSEAGEWIHQYLNIPSPYFRSAAGFAFILIIGLIVFAIINAILGKLVDRGPVKAIDRFLGAALGAILAGLVVVAIMVLVRGIGWDNADWWNNSTLIPHFQPFVELIEDILPEGLAPEASEEGVPAEVVPTEEAKAEEET